MSESVDCQGPIEKMTIYMELRGLRPNTVRTFATSAERFLSDAGKPPSAITGDDVRGFLLHLVRQGRSPCTRNVNLAAIRCLLEATLGDDAQRVTASIPYAKYRRSCPEILSGSEVMRLLDGTTSPKYRAIFMLMYGAGLRISEVIGLDVSDIDSQRMVIRVREGKTGPRYVMLSLRVLEALRAYYRTERPKGPELFPGGREEQPGTRLSGKTISRVLAKVAREVGIKKRVYPHLLRHCYATHLLEAGADVRSVQMLLGHACLESTTTYLHLSHAHLRATPSPIDLLGTPAGKVLG